MRLASTLVLLVAVGLGGFMAHAVFTHRNEDPVRHHGSALTIEKLRKLSSLVTMEVPISDVRVTTLDGVVGSTQMVVAVRGDVQIGVDLSEAAFEDVDEQAHSALLVLKTPQAGRPRIDHEKTRVLAIERSGLWKWVPGQAGEKTLTDRAMAEAQAHLLEVAQRPDIVAKACGHTEKVIQEFFGAMGWDVAVQWDDRAPAQLEKAQEPDAKP